MSSLAELSPVAKIGRYDVIGRLASGGMAEIFLARESGPHNLDRHLVVKRILPHVADDERMVEMFLHEAKLCMNLKHPNICPIYEFAEEAGTLFLAMEWVRGASLRDLIDQTGPLPLPLAVKICADVAGALHHAHTVTDTRGKRLEIVHRDVNPENVMVGFDGVPKLLDFGVAKAATQRKHKTEAGNLKGKFAYISPEQYQGQELDGRSDVFSLGVTLYEAITGQSLYDRASEYETVAAIVLDPDIPSLRASNPDVPPELDAIVQTALAKDRDQRYSSADELQRALMTFAGREGWTIRSADVSSTLRRLAPNMVDAEPTLDRDVSGFGKSEAYKPSPDETLRAMLLAAEADEEMEEAYGKRGNSGTILALVSLLIILGSAGVIYWVVQGRSAAPSGTETPLPASLDAGVASDASAPLTDAGGDGGAAADAGSEPPDGASP
ncbi:MAG: serine/threonine protein kinase [Sandaracinaceae bacterium]